MFNRPQGWDHIRPERMGKGVDAWVPMEGPRGLRAWSASGPIMRFSWPAAAEIRARTQKILRGGAAYEGARH